MTSIESKPVSYLDYILVPFSESGFTNSNKLRVQKLLAAGYEPYGPPISVRVNSSQVCGHQAFVLRVERIWRA
jgi:hypothetical protein